MQDNIAPIKLMEYDPPQKSEKENRNGKWVDYGDENDYPLYTLTLYRNSTTNHAVIDKMSQMILGKGITSIDPSQNEAIKALGIDDELDKLVFDFYCHGGCYLEVIRSKGDKPLKVNHLPFENCRLAIAEEGEEDVKGIFYSTNWEEYRKDKYKPVEIPVFDAQSKDARSVVIIQKTTPGSIYYPSPSYEGAINYIEAEIQIGIYHNNQLLNGFFPSIIANFFNGQPSLEERNEVMLNLERKIGGVKNAGKVLATFNEPGTDNRPTFEAFPITDADKQYEFLSKLCTEMILRGHRVVNPILFGVKEGSGLGNNANEEYEARLQMEHDVIIPDREAILKQLRPLFESVGINAEWESEKIFDKNSIDKLTNLIEKVSDGSMTAQQARILAVDVIGINDGTANDLFPIVETTPQILSDKKKVPTLTEDWGNALAEALSRYGETVEDLENDGWELVAVEDAGSHEDEDGITFENLLQRVNLASPESYANPGERSTWGDSGLYKLRYRYSQNLSGNSRAFCTQMVGISKAGFIFRKEDIDNMSNDSSVNGQFAPQGLSTYDIFQWKGGVYCHHKWERLIFFRKRDANGQFLPPSPESAKTEQGMTNDKRVGNVPFVPQKGQEGTAPINTPSRGSLKNS